MPNCKGVVAIYPTVGVLYSCLATTCFEGGIRLKDTLDSTGRLQLHRAPKSVLRSSYEKIGSSVQISQSEVCGDFA